jgi:Transcriptional regulators
MKLNETEKRIYQYLISTDIEDKSAEKVATELFISRSAIYRVCKKMGYTSYSQFKHSRTSLQAEKQRMLKEVDALDVFSHVNDEEMEVIIKRLITSKHIFVIGTYATSIAARYFVRQLLNLGFFVVLCVDEFELRMRSKDIGENDVIIYFSNSGRFRPHYYLLTELKAPTIGITKAESKLALACSHAITFDFSLYKDDKSFDRENIFPLIVIAQKLLINIKEQI